jgi:hypothetical protein
VPYCAPVFTLQMTTFLGASPGSPTKKVAVNLQMESPQGSPGNYMVDNDSQVENIMTAFKPHMPNTKTDNVVCMRYHTRWVQEVGFHTWGLTGREHGDPSTMSPFRILFER